jgi:hypothetical protein
MVGTIEQVLEVKRETKALEEMSDFEMRRLPRGLRIDVPLKSTIEVKAVARHLRAFADTMEREAKRQDLTPFQILWNVWTANRTLRDRIEEICKTGWKYRKEQNEQ